MVSIARKNLLEDLPRFLVAQAGIMFAVSLVTIQAGILEGFTRSTTLLIEQSQADIWVASDQMVHFALTEPLLLNNLTQARQVEGVQKAEALMLTPSRWRSSLVKSVPVTVIGFDPAGQLFQPGQTIQGKLATLKRPYAVMVDRSKLSSLGVQGIGDRALVGKLPVQIGAITQESQSIAAAVFLFTSLENANTYTQGDFTTTLNCRMQPEKDLQCTQVYEKSANKPESDSSETPTLKPLTSTASITYVLVKGKPGEDLETLKQRLETALPGTKAYTKAELSQKTQAYWKGRTSIGFILGLGAAVGAIVGMVVVSQILYSSVSDHIKEFGTLKAMGAPNRVLYRVIIEQSLWMAVLGYIPGMLLCWGVSQWVASQGILILITPATAVGVFGLVVIMCIGSGFLAIQKVTHVDPAIVFKA